MSSFRVLNPANIIGEAPVDNFKDVVIDALAEFFGMAFFLVISIGTAVAGQGGVVNRLEMAFVFGFSIFVLATSLGGISGGHFNPAVSFALFVAGELSVIRTVLYILAQLLGGIVGVALVVAINPWEYVRTSCLAVNQVASIVKPGAALVGEIIFTSLLLLAVFFVIRNKSSVPPAIATFSIGMSVFLGHLVMIPLDNCSINPARSFASSVVLSIWNSANEDENTAWLAARNLVVPKDVDACPNQWDDHWVFWVGPLIASILVGGGYRVLHAYLNQETVPSSSPLFGGFSGFKLPTPFSNNKKDKDSSSSSDDVEAQPIEADSGSASGSGSKSGSGSGSSSKSGSDSGSGSSSSSSSSSS